MNYPVNASVEEIRNYFKNNNVQWVLTLRNNEVPESLILEFKNRFFKGDCASRVQEMIFMMQRTGTMITNKEIIENVFNNIYPGYIKGLESVFPLYEFYLEQTDEYLIENHANFNSIFTFDTCPPLELVKRYNNLDIGQYKKFDSYDNFILRDNIDSEVREFVVGELKELFKTIDKRLHILRYREKTNVFDMFTPLEYISLVNPSNIIDFFDSWDSGYASTGDLMLFKQDDIVEFVVNSILEAHSEGKYQEVRSDKWKLTRELIKDHPRAGEITELLMPETEFLLSEYLNWNEVDVKIRDGQFSSDTVSMILQRLDAPLWFTDKYQSKILQLLLVNSKKDGYREGYSFNDMRHHRFNDSFERRF